MQTCSHFGAEPACDSRTRSQSKSGRPPPKSLQAPTALRVRSSTFGASNSPNVAPPARMRTPTRTLPISSSSAMIASLSPLTSERAKLSQKDGGAERRMAGEGQLPAGRENANARRVTGAGRRQHEHRLREIELARNRLHFRAAQPVRSEHDGERIAAERPLCENVKDVIGKRHCAPSPRCRRPVRTSAQAAAP